jgi:hypothetical protein
LSIGEGQTLCLVGESGCGKRATALSLARLLATPPARYVGGEILLQGRDVLMMTAAELRDIRGGVVSYVFQEPGASLSPVMRIGAQMMESLKLHRPAKATEEEIIRLLHDKFHVSAHLNEAVDQVRRAEHKELMAAGDETLQGSRPLWLYNPMNFSDEQAAGFAALKDSGLKVVRAWAAKELFTKLWTYRYEGAARRFFKQWFGWVSRSRLKPLIEVARMLKSHLENILTYLRHPITNAVTEGLNSKLQMITPNAHGFRSFDNYRIRILFFCGKLDLYPL